MRKILNISVLVLVLVLALVAGWSCTAAADNLKNEILLKGPGNSTIFQVNATAIEWMGDNLNATSSGSGLASTLISNAEGRIASRSTTYSNATIPALVNATSITAGVVDCAASQVHSLVVGNLIHWDVSPDNGTGNTFNVVTAVTNSTRFTIDNTGITNSTAQDAYKVMRKIVNTGNYCIDGHSKGNDHEVWVDRDTVTNGMWASLKVTTGATGTGSINWPNDILGEHTVFSHVKRFAGRTVTYGRWVKTSAASKVRLGIYGGSYTYSSYHTGGGGWEWLEVTKTISSTPAYVLFSAFTGASNTAYFGPEMLVFGSVIGAGNFVPQQNEVINLETGVQSSRYYGLVSWSTTAESALNIIADSAGKIGPGVKEVNVFATCNDSGSAGSDSAFLDFSASRLPRVIINAAGLANDRLARGQGWAGVDASSQIGIGATATGTGTLDTQYVTYHAVIVR